MKTTIEDVLDRHTKILNCQLIGRYKDSALNAMQEWASIQTPPTWVRVEDGLPEVSTPDKLNKVQVFCEVLGVSDGYYWGENNDPCKGWSIMKVTHWMPLPNKPSI